jgi:hypothetical protein
VSEALRVESSSDGSVASRRLAYSAFLLIGALYVVGIVSNGMVRHAVQTAPVWPTVALGARRSLWSKWTALPCFLFWLFLMMLIWLSLLGWVHVISGTFSPIEIAMTLIVGIFSVVGIVLSMQIRTDTRAINAALLFLFMVIVQLVAVRISFLPALAHDHWR